MKRLIVLALVAGGFWFYWTRWRPAHSYTQLSARLQTAVNHELSEAGITDKDVLRNVQQERSRFGLDWIETDRQIQANPKIYAALLNKVSAQAKKLGCTVLRREETPTEARIELGKGPFLMQRLVLVPPVVSSLPQTPEVAIVIDDVAYDFPPMDHFAALGVPLTFAILPRDRHSKALAEKAVQMNFPVILHLPMEPQDMVHNNPGGAGLYLNMTPKQLKEQFEKDVASVPHIQGINNHMGSAFTEDTPKMTLVLSWIKEKKLFFLDSRTSTKSVAPHIAKQIGLPCLINETFLDNEDTAESIEKQLDIVLKLALQRKRTIAIGHYRRKHLVEALAAKLPEFKAHGVTFVGLPSFYPKTY